MKIFGVMHVINLFNLCHYPSSVARLARVGRTCSAVQVVIDTGQKTADNGQWVVTAPCQRQRESFAQHRRLLSYGSKIHPNRKAFEAIRILMLNKHLRPVAYTARTVTMSFVARRNNLIECAATSTFKSSAAETTVDSNIAEKVQLITIRRHVTVGHDQHVLSSLITPAAAQSGLGLLVRWLSSGTYCAGRHKPVSKW